MNIILFHPDEQLEHLPCDDYRARHLVQILGARVGCAYRAGIIGGAVGRILIRAINSQGVSVRFTPSERESPPPLLPLTLIIGHPRPPVAKRLVVDLASIGARSIHFFIGENSEKSYLQSRIWRDGMLKQCRITGAEQAGTTLIPELDCHRDLARALRSVDADPAAERQYLALPDELSVLGEKSTRLHIPSSMPAVAIAPEPVPAPEPAVAPVLASATEPATAPATAPAPAVAPAHTQPRPTSDSQAHPGTTSDSKPMIIAVGAERGWTAGEIGMLQEHGYHPRTLGQRILRTATATIAVSVLAAQRYYAEQRDYAE